jgi:pimeloyl-ACP methyl ester carboxylesterase
MREVSFANGDLTGIQVGTGRDLVILHSLLADRTAFDPVLSQLATRFRVTLVNLPGFGGSRPIAAGIEGYADHLAQIFVDGAFGSDAILMGNGFGGTVAVAMAIRHGAHFGPLVLCDVAAGFPPEGRKAFEVMADKVATEGLGSVALIAAKRVFHDAYLAAKPEAIEVRRQVLLKIAPEAFVAACQTLVGTDLVPQLETIRNPTLVVYGELDAATPPVLCRQLASGIAGAQIIELPGCGHCPPLEQPEAFLAAVLPFIG